MKPAKQSCTRACIEVDRVLKKYRDVNAVNGLSFCVNNNEIFGILGPNGAGKTSVIRMMLSMIRPDSGDIKIFGKNFSESAKQFVGYLPEDRGLYERLTVMENLTYLASLNGIEEDIAVKNAVDLLHKVDLIEFADRKVGILSKGMKQLVQLVAALVHNPKLLVLDEPFSGLDPANRRLVKELILEQKKLGKTIVLSTHLMEEVEALCDRIVVVNRGRRILYGEVSDIKDRYASHCIFVEFSGKLPKLAGVEKIDAKKGSADIYLRLDTSPLEILKQLALKDVDVRRFDVKELSLGQIFIQIVEAEKKWEKF